jgi:hypothetical protein
MSYQLRPSDRMLLICKALKLVYARTEATLQVQQWFCQGQTIHIINWTTIDPHEFSAAIYPHQRASKR